MAEDRALAGAVRRLAALPDPTPKFGATVELRYRKVSFGPPVLQQFWVLLANGPRRGEWRDVPVEAVE